MILRCTCKHDFQDKTYGSGMRVHNPCPPKGKTDDPKYRCTVCGAERTAKEGA